MHTLRQNAYGLVHARLCKVQKLLCHGSYCELILSRAGCCLPSAILLARAIQSPDAVRSRNPSKSTLVHDAVAAAVLHKHYSIIHVGAGLIQFVHGSHLLVQILGDCSLFDEIGSITYTPAQIYGTQSMNFCIIPISIRTGLATAMLNVLLINFKWSPLQEEPKTSITTDT